MRIHSIFEVLKNKLYAVAYAKNKTILTVLQDRWSDPMWLDDFFEAHKRDLQFGIWGSISIDKAISTTIEESHLLFTNLVELNGEKIDDIFQPLHKDDFDYVEFQFLKAKGGLNKNSWLRLYALKFNNKFIITGGAIKLTRAMQDRDHTKIELTKLKNLRQKLRLGDSNELFVYIE